MVRDPKPKRRVIQAIRKYGVECRCCGEPRIEFLSVVEAPVLEGERHNSKFNYAWLEKQKYPTGFVTVCANCRQSMEELGFCPHSKEANYVPSTLCKLKSRKGNSEEVRSKIISEATINEGCRQYMNERWADDPNLDKISLIVEYESLKKRKHPSRLPNRDSLEDGMLDILQGLHETHK